MKASGPFGEMVKKALTVAAKLYVTPKQTLKAWPAFMKWGGVL